VLRRRPADAASRSERYGRRADRGSACSSRLSTPTVMGLAALVAASAGALAVGAETSGASTLTPGLTRHVAQHSTQGLGRGRTDATVAATPAGDDVMPLRVRALSRSSARDAATTHHDALDARDAHLQAAAESQARRRTTALASLADRADRRSAVLARRAWTVPVTRGVYHLTAGFGQCSGLWSHCHTGLDFASPDGTPIHAVAGGTVTEVTWAGAYGNRTIETLPDGTELWYCHQSATGVAVGQRVATGQVIGAVGSTGNVTGPHVHLEVRPGGGDPVDPRTALIAHGVTP